LFNIHTCTCMVLTTPVERHAYSPQKLHMHSCMRAYAIVQKLLRYGSYCELTLSLARASCRLSFTACSCHPSCCLDQPPSPDAFRSRILSKSTLSHDAVAAAVSHKHHSSVRVGAGLIQFVYVSHCAWPRTSPSQSSSFAKVFAGFLSKSNHQ